MKDLKSRLDISRQIQKVEPNVEIGNQKIVAKNGLLVSEQRVYQPQAEIEYASDLKDL